MIRFVIEQITGYLGTLIIITVVKIIVFFDFEFLQVLEWLQCIDRLVVWS